MNATAGAYETAFDRVIAAIEKATGHGTRGDGNRRQARCPAHDDSNPSLSITRGADRVLLHCHADCSIDDILAALHLTTADLYDEPARRGSDIVATYDYVDAAGKLLFQVCRLLPKSFRQRRPDGLGGWEWRRGETTALYRLPAVIAAVGAGTPIYVVEGEKDVHAAERAGAVATCNPGGAGKWHPSYTAVLRGAHVHVVADRDDPGRRHAWAVRDALQGAAADVDVLEPADGKDLSDHLATGHTLDQLVARPRLELADAPDEDIVARAYPRVDIAKLLADEQVERDWVIERIIPAGTGVAIVAPAGHGKSLLTLAITTAVASGAPELGGLIIPRRRRVLTIDMENTLLDYRERLSNLGWTPSNAGELDDFVLISFPTIAPLDTPAGGAELLAICDYYEIGADDVVILDSTQRLTVGAENDADTYRALYRCTLMPLKARGTTVIRLDNTGKDVTRGARGSSSKRDDVDLEWVAHKEGDLITLTPNKTRIGATEILTVQMYDDGDSLFFTALRDAGDIKVDQCIRDLEKLGVPPDTAIRPSCDTLRNAGIKHPKSTVEKAVKRRKMRNRGTENV